jgi:lipoyl-dependent peroxiredoxin
MKVLYTAEAHVDGGREGHARSSDGRLDVELSAPPTGADDTGTGTNPEQMFAAGYGACFLGAVEVVARRMRLEVSDLSADVKVSLGANPDRTYGLAVELIIGLSGVDRETTQKVLEEAHKTCPYSNATRGNVEVTLTALEG